MDDKLIIKNIKRRKEQGLEWLVNKYGGFISALIKQNMNSLSNYHDECMDDVLLSIWDNIDKFDDSKNTFKNWIASITKYRVIDYKRKYIRTLQQEDIENYQFEDKSSTEEEILKQELRGEIEGLLDNLKARDKELFIKHYLEDTNIDILSKEMGVKTSVLYNRLSRGRTKLKALICGDRF